MTSFMDFQLLTGCEMDPKHIQHLEQFVELEEVAAHIMLPELGV